MANTITDVYFLDLFDEFNRISKTKINAFIGVATMRVDAATWGAAAPYATALLTAHMLTMSGRSGVGAGGGAVTSESVGELSRAFATVGVPGSGDQELLTTRYGQDFVALRREQLVSADVTGPNTILPPQQRIPFGTVC